MADEPRRSVRATKGQHTKSLDVLDQTAEPKKKATKKSKKAAQQEEEEEVELIRCVCGATETGNDDGEPWIACDNCAAWQHNVCVGVSTYDEDVPENYLCEQCGPEFHKPLLEAIKRGEKLWEERRALYEIEKAEAEKEGPKKRGKKGRGKSMGDSKQETPKPTNGKAKSPSLPVEPPKDKKEPVARAGSTKRKTRDESHDKETPKEPLSKIRKVSAAATPQPKSPEFGLPAKISDLETTRQTIANAFKKTLSQTIPVTIKSGSYGLKADDTLDAKSERLAIEIEDAIFKTHPDKTAYTKQFRTVAANLKHNQELCDGLLTRKLSPQSLAVMSSDDMASSELKRETAEMKARAEKQSIMITDDGPRVRRTHKGEEVIEDDNFAVANDSTMSTSRRRSMLDPNADMATRSRENSPGNEVELPESIDDYRSRDDIRGNTIPKQPLKVETKSSQEPVRKASDANFDIAKVFSSVQSPTNTQHRRASSAVNAQVKNTGADADIDRMLQDDEGNESPPYSPAEYNSDPDALWRGTVTMDSIAKFPAVAKYAAGADLSQKLPWNDLIQKELKIAGRIGTDRANEYLCSLRYSPHTDIAVVAISPSGEAAGSGFNALYDYFHSKGRYGVFANKGTGNVRDTYLVPVPPSPANLPDFITNLEGHKVPENRSDPMLLISIVIRNEYQAAQQVDGSSDVQSTPVTGHPQRQMSISGIGPAMSPINTQTGFPPAPSPQVPMHNSIEEAQRRQADQQRRATQEEGEAAAARILGHHIKAPTVAFLLPQAFQMRTVEWEIIRDILEEDVKAREDLQHLSQLIEVRTKS